MKSAIRVLNKPGFGICDERAKQCFKIELETPSLPLPENLSSAFHYILPCFSLTRDVTSFTELTSHHNEFQDT